MLLKLKVSIFHSLGNISVFQYNNISEYTLLIRAAQETDTELNGSFDQKLQKKLENQVERAFAIFT